MRFLESVIAAAVSSLLILPINTCFAQSMPSAAEVAAQQAIFNAQMKQIPTVIKPADPLSQNFGKGIQLPKADPGQIAKRLANAGKEKVGIDMMVFVSLAMPREVLVELSKQARQFDATLMLRGFTADSMTKTQEAIAALNEGGAAWQVNPDAFKTFKVKTVPAFILATANASSILEEGCAIPMNYSMVRGNQSIEVALQTIRRRSTNPALASKANLMLTK
jgi:conjugal transfer pilus assembly protein TrbC